MSETGGERLGRLLVGAGVIQEAHLKRGAASLAGTALSLVKSLIADGSMTEDAYTSFLARYCRVPFVSILDEIVSPEALSILPPEFCIANKVLPMSVTADDLTVAMVNPTEVGALQKIRKYVPDRTIRAIGCSVEHFTEVARRVFKDNADFADRIGDLEAEASETAEDFIKRVVANIEEEEERLKFLEASASNALSAMAGKIRVFEGVPPMDVASVLSAGMIEEYEAGRSIFHKGSGGGELYVVISGSVEITDGAHTLATMTPGDVFGEIAYFANTVRTASAVARERSAVLCLGEDDLETLIRGEWGSRILLNLFGMLTERLGRMNDRIRQLENR